MSAAIATPPAESVVRRALAPRRFAGVTLESPAALRAARGSTRHAVRRPGSSIATIPARRTTARPLHLQGPPVDLVTISDPETLPVHEQLVADGLVAELEAQARRALRSGYEHCCGLAHADRYPSLPQWLALRGSAFALHSLLPPVAGRSARGRLRLRGPAHAPLRRRVGDRRAAHAARLRARRPDRRPPSRVLRGADDRRGAAAHGWRDRCARASASAR